MSDDRSKRLMDLRHAMEEHNIAASLERVISSTQFEYGQWVPFERLRKEKKNALSEAMVPFTNEKPEDLVRDLVSVRLEEGNQ